MMHRQPVVMDRLWIEQFSDQSFYRINIYAGLVDIRLGQLKVTYVCSFLRLVTVVNILCCVWYNSLSLQYVGR